jgi:hypothetical protein
MALRLVVLRRCDVHDPKANDQTNKNIPLCTFLYWCCLDGRCVLRCCYCLLQVLIIVCTGEAIVLPPYCFNRGIRKHCQREFQLLIYMHDDRNYLPDIKTCQIVEPASQS